MNQQFNKRLLCCFRLTTSHTVGREVKKEQMHQRQETLSNLSFFMVSNLWSVQSQRYHASPFVCRTTVRPLWVKAQCQRRDFRVVSGGRRRAHLPTCIMEKLPSAAALWLFPNLQSSRLSLCRTCLLSVLSVREQQRRLHKLYEPPPSAEVRPWCGLNKEEFV